MKDAAHHLKQVQRKIIQSARKEGLIEPSNMVVGSGVEQVKRAAPSRRYNRFPENNTIH